MESSNQNEMGKIIKSFCIVGLNEQKLTEYYEAKSDPYVQNIDVIHKDIKETKDKIELENEKWIRIMKNSNSWLRIQYSKTYQNPITELRIAECDYESPEYLLIPKKYVDQNFKAIRLTESKDNDNSSIPISKENELIEPYNDYYMKIPSYCNVKDYLKLPVKSHGALLLISRNIKSLPLKDVKIQPAPQHNSYQLGVIKHKSPYTYIYLPELLDSYPRDENVNPGIAVFCFPEGIKIKTSQEMPKWFNIILTDEGGVRSYGSVLIFTEVMSKELQESFVPRYKPKEKLYVEKAICLLSNYPFFYNCKIFLRELYRIQVSSGTKIPLERAICYFVDSLFFESFDKVLSFSIAEEELKFYRIPIYGSEWDTNDDCLEILFNLLSYETIITVWEGLLLERKVFLLSSSKSALFNVSMGLINLLFPFKWIHVLVPILPEKLKVFIESPVPFIIGMNYSIDLNLLPSESLILNIDKNTFENYNEKVPKLPSKLLSNMMKKLNKIKTKFSIDNPMNIEQQMSYLDSVFPSVEIENKGKFDASEIRDIFYDFFIHMFKNYEKYFNWKKKKNNKEVDEPLQFLKEVFLKDHSSIDQDSFLYKFSETSIFSQFEDTFKYIEPNSPTSYFIDSIKKGKGKSKHFFPNKIPSISLVKSEIQCNDLGGKSFFYSTFPDKLDSKLFIQSEEPRKVYISRFLCTRDEWCFDPQKLINKDWAKFLMYSIYEIWFTFFSFVINFYDDKKANTLMSFAIALIDDLINKKRICPSKNLMTKIVKLCCRECLTLHVKPFLNLVNTNNKNYNALFHNAFVNGLYWIIDNYKKRQLVMNDLIDNNTNEELESRLEKTFFLSYEFCPYCLKNKKNPKKIIIEEVLAGFSRSKSDYNSICPSCLNKIFPKIYFLREDQTTLDTETVNFLSPLVLVKEVDNLIKNHGEEYFYHEDFFKDNYHRHIFWNLSFYFQLFDLPLCVMYVENDNIKFEKIKDLLEENKERRINQKKNHRSSILNKSSDNGNNIVQTDTSQRKYSNTSKKHSSTSNDVLSISGRSGVNNLPKLEQDLWKGIQEKVEKTATSAMMRKAAERNNNNKDRGEINAKIYDIRQTLSKCMEYFVHNMKSRLETLLGKLEELEDRGEENLPLSNFDSFPQTRSDSKIELNDKFQNQQQEIMSSNVNLNTNIKPFNTNEKIEDDVIKNLESYETKHKLNDIQNKVNLTELDDIKENEKTSKHQHPPQNSFLLSWKRNDEISNVNINMLKQTPKKKVLSYKVVINNKK